MPRPKDPTSKVHDPAYQAARNRENRHKYRTQLSIRIPPEVHARWHAAAAREGRTLKDWAVHYLERAADRAESPAGDDRA